MHGTYAIGSPKGPEVEQRLASVSSPPLPTVRKNVPVHMQPQPAQEIIEQTGSNWSIRLISQHEKDKQSLSPPRVKQLASPARNDGAQLNVKTQDTRPKEKLQNQLNTITPMQIVRAQPFFSRHSLILRDQLEEYVQGFPATKAHRQIIAKAYNMDPMELGHVEAIGKIKEKPSTKNPYQNIREMKTSAARVSPEKPSTAGDPLVEQLMPDKDLPVDPERLKKAIKNALIKNDNQPEKIDI